MNYAAAVVLEVRQPASSVEPVIRFNFKNGTDDEDFREYPMSIPGWARFPVSGEGSAGPDVPLSTFISAFQPAGINTTLQWCNVCAQTEARGCAALFAGNGTETSGHTIRVNVHDAISPVGAGFLGAGLTIVVYGLGLAILAYLGLLTFGKRARTASRQKYGTNDHTELHSSVSDSNPIHA